MCEAVKLSHNSSYLKNLSHIEIRKKTLSSQPYTRAHTHTAKHINTFLKNLATVQLLSMTTFQDFSVSTVVVSFLLGISVSLYILLRMTHAEYKILWHDIKEANSLITHEL